MAKKHHEIELDEGGDVLRDESDESIGPSLAAGDIERFEKTTVPSAFWKLPREIRDMIYDDVYGGDGTVKVVVRQGWEWRERFQRSRYPTVSPPRDDPFICPPFQFSSTNWGIAEIFSRLSIEQYASQQAVSERGKSTLRGVKSLLL